MIPKTTNIPNIIDTEDTQESVIGVVVTSPNEVSKCCICLNTNQIKYECSACQGRVKDGTSHTAKICLDCGYSLMESGFGGACPVCKKESPWCRDVETQQHITAKPNLIIHNTPTRQRLTQNQNIVVQEKMYKYMKIIIQIIGTIIISFILGLIVRLILGHCVFTCDHIIIDLLHTMMIGVMCLLCISIVTLCCGVCCIGALTLGSSQND
jgi:hypothetical protein